MMVGIFWFDSGRNFGMVGPEDSIHGWTPSPLLFLQGQHFCYRRSMFLSLKGITHERPPCLWSSPIYSMFGANLIFALWIHTDDTRRRQRNVSWGRLPWDTSWTRSFLQPIGSNRWPHLENMHHVVFLVRGYPDSKKNTRKIQFSSMYPEFVAAYSLGIQIYRN